MISADAAAECRFFIIQDREGALDVDVYADIDGIILSQTNVSCIDEDTVTLTWAQVLGLMEAIERITE